MIMKMWIARDENGMIFLHSIRPYKVGRGLYPAYWNNEEENAMLLGSKYTFPEVTFENSPMEVELKLIEK